MSIYSQTILQDSPLAYWRLGELSGATAADSSGNSRSGTYHSCTLGLAGGVAADNNAAASFDGASSYVDCPSLSLSSNFSTEAWGYKTAAGIATIAAQGDSVPTQLSFFFRLASSSGFTGSSANVTVPDAAPNSWHHHVLTYDGATLRYYLDGALNASQTTSGSPLSLTNHTAIGRLGEASSQFWPGLLDEVAIYGSTLSAARVAAHYQAGIAAGILAPPVGRSPFVK